MEKVGFSDDGGVRGVVGYARRQQMILLEEARGQTVPHVLVREFHRRTGDQRMSACGEGFFGEASIRG